MVVSGKAGESLLTALLDFGDGKKQWLEFISIRLIKLKKKEKKYKLE